MTKKPVKSAKPVSKKPAVSHDDLEAIKASATAAETSAIGAQQSIIDAITQPYHVVKGLTPQINTAAPALYARDLPEVTIQVCTYDRFDMLLDNIGILSRALQYPADKLRWLISDDHSPDNYGDRVYNAIREQTGIEAVISSTAERSGWSANVNLGLSKIETPYTFFIEDDYSAGCYIPLDAAVALMEVKPNIGMIRFRGTAGTHLVYHGFEADISEIMPDYQDGYGVPGKIQYLQLDSGSPTPYLYSHGAHLKRNGEKGFHSFYGNYPVTTADLGAPADPPRKLKLGETEESYAHMVKDKMKADWQNAPAIVIFPSFVVNGFNHIGKSYQHTALDG